MLTVAEQGTVVQYVLDNIQTKVVIPEVAKQVGMEVRWFSKLFKASFAGWSFHYYLTNKRCDVAERLLANTDMKLGDIATATGFANQTHFGHVLHKLRGHTPLKYRKAAQYGK